MQVLGHFFKKMIYSYFNNFPTLDKKLKFICIYQKKSVPLHRKSKQIVYIFATK
jgi:hypothetical protein